MSKKRALIIKEPNAKITCNHNCIEVTTFYAEQIIGFEQIASCYIHFHANVKMKTALQIAKKVPIFLIDAHGTLLAQINTEV